MRSPLRKVLDVVAVFVVALYLAPLYWIALTSIKPTVHINSKEPVWALRAHPRALRRGIHPLRVRKGAGEQLDHRHHRHVHHHGPRDDGGLRARENEDEGRRHDVARHSLAALHAGGGHRDALLPDVPAPRAHRYPRGDDRHLHRVRPALRGVAAAGLPARPATGYRGGGAPGRTRLDANSGSHHPAPLRPRDRGDRDLHVRVQLERVPLRALHHPERRGHPPHSDLPR